MACTSGSKNIAAVLAVYTGVQAIDGRMGDFEVYPAHVGIDPPLPLANWAVLLLTWM